MPNPTKEETLKGAPDQITLFPDVDNSDDPVTDEPDENAVKIAALEKTIQDGKDREDRLNETVSNLSKAPQPTGSVLASLVPPVEAEAPDPITDPEGYKAHVKAEVTGEVDQKLNKMTADTNRAKLYDAMWGEFATSNPELAKDHMDYVKFNATQLLQEAAQAGHNPEQYLLQNKTVFMKDLADRSNSGISKIRGDSLDTGRTGGVLGDSPRHIVPKPNGTEVKKSSFVEELKKVQMATGFL